MLNLLRERLPEGVEAAALAAVRAAPPDELTGWAAAAAALADDGDHEPALRCAALLAVALLCQRGAPVPEAALAALGDDVLLDAALEEGIAAAITGIAAAAGDRMAGEDRRYLSRRLVAASAAGEHIAALHLSTGELEAAAVALAGGLDAVLRDHTPGDDAAVAVAHLAVVWAVEHGARFIEPLAAALSPATRAAVAKAVRAAGAGDLHPLLRALAR